MLDFEKMNHQADLEVRVQDGGSEGERRSKYDEATVKQFSDYSKLIMTMIGGTVASYYPIREDMAKHASRPYFLVCFGLLSSAFFTDFALMLLASCMLQSRRFSEFHYIVAKILVHFIGILMILTSVSLLLLLNPRNAVITILALPPMAIVIIISCNEIRTRRQGLEVINDEAHRQELKQFFDHSAQVTVAAFGGMIAIIFGYFKHFAKDVNPPVKFSVDFIFFTVIAGLLVVLLTTVPPSLSPDKPRSRYIIFIKVLSCSLFSLLALIGLAVPAEFLGQLIFLALLPIFFAVVIWFIADILREDGTSLAHGATAPPSEPDTSSVTITTFIFSALMVVYSFYFSGKHDDFHLKTCMFFLSLAFMSSLTWTWMLLAFRPPRRQSLAMAVRILTYSTIVSTVFAVLDLIFLTINETVYHKGQH